MGAALLAKGLIGVVIPAGVAGVYYLLRRRWPDAWKSVFWGFLLTVGVAALWYAPVIARHGWTFVDEFFVKHHFARYLSNKYHHPQPFWFYFAIIPALMLPWSAFLASGVEHARRWHWRGEDALSKLRIFALAWLLFPLLFFSVSGSKLPGYILPALPGAALLAGERLASFLRGEGSARALRVNRRRERVRVVCDAATRTACVARRRRFFPDPDADRELRGGACGGARVGARPAARGGGTRLWRVAGLEPAQRRAHGPVLRGGSSDLRRGGGRALEV
jgi:4-amino-4-deoxy-L-arabinose transferase-like glycosyltransferase